MSYPVKTVKKLIEVALPLDAINAAAAREKSIRHGHPSTLHLWWARRPLAAARAVIFAQLVNDPSGRWELENPGKLPPNHLKASWAAKRKQLFKIIEDLVIWENTTNEDVLERARNEIKKSWREVCDLNKKHPHASELFNPDTPPALHDPFAGGGAIPLEAQRLGLEVYASDLNPVAVLINKAMIEIPIIFSGRRPIGPIPQGETPPIMQDAWKGASGLAEDVRRYGECMKSKAKKTLESLYPEIEITKDMALTRPDLCPLVGEKLTIIAWIWARTIKSPNPAFRDSETPLASTFILSSQKGREAYIEPILCGKSFHFEVKVGNIPSYAKDGTKLSQGSFKCIFSNTPFKYEYIDAEASLGNMSKRMMAIVADSKLGRVYLSPDPTQEELEKKAVPEWKPLSKCRGTFASNAQGRKYGFETFGDYFTSRQLKALSTLSSLLPEFIDSATKDAIQSGYSTDTKKLESGGQGAFAYGEAIGVYLSLAISKITNITSSMATWMNDRGAFRETFARQGIPMTWDFVEANPFADTGGSFGTTIGKIAMAITNFPASGFGLSIQSDAQSQSISSGKVISTDPPYYDNIGYSDLSDYFYVWLRHCLNTVYPTLFTTVVTPKKEELIASHYRHESKANAEIFFMQGMSLAMQRLLLLSHPEPPITIYYAFKQSETEESGGTASTGWETFLEAVIQSGLSITGTWPMRTEGAGRLIAKDTNALASSIILVCRRRPEDAPTASRREFIRELNIVLPDALEEMIHGTDTGKSPVAPVDLSQAVIGPGMGVFSKYSAVLEADGSRMSVRTALQLINKYFLENDFDPETQWCLKWFEQNGWKEGVFGQADDLSRALGTSVDGVAETGVIESGGGKVRLLRPSEYPTDWDPHKDKRIPIWETLHHLIRSLRTDGETQTGRLLGAVKNQIEGVRLLAFRLYTLCERAGWADDARTYNELMTSWTAVETAAGQVKIADRQGELF